MTVTSAAVVCCAAKPKEERVDVVPPRLVAEAPLLSVATAGPEMATVAVDANLPTQTELPDELEENSVPCSATQTDSPFTSRPNKNNLHITHVYDTKDEKCTLSPIALIFLIQY